MATCSGLRWAIAICSNSSETSCSIRSSHGRGNRAGEGRGDERDRSFAREIFDDCLFFPRISEKGRQRTETNHDCALLAMRDTTFFPFFFSARDDGHVVHASMRAREH